MNYQISPTTEMMQWSSDYDKNFKTFAENIALSIVKKALYNLAETNNSKHKSTTIISFEITKSQNAKIMSQLLDGCEVLPPFKEWLNKFSAKPLDQDPNDFDNDMAVIGDLATTNVFALLRKHQSITPNFQFTATWYPKKYKQFVSLSEAKVNTLSIELWFQEKAIVKKENFFNSDTLNKALMVALCVFTAFIHIRCEVFKKTLTLPPNYL